MTLLPESLPDDIEALRAFAISTIAERDAAIRAARGGGFWSRLRRNAKWFAVGAATAALATKAGR